MRITLRGGNGPGNAALLHDGPLVSLGLADLNGEIDERNQNCHGPDGVSEAFKLLETHFATLPDS